MEQCTVSGPRLPANQWGVLVLILKTVYGCIRYKKVALKNWISQHLKATLTYTTTLGDVHHHLYLEWVVLIKRSCLIWESSTHTLRYSATFEIASTNVMMKCCQWVCAESLCCSIEHWLLSFGLSYQTCFVHALPWVQSAVIAAELILIQSLKWPFSCRKPLLQSKRNQAPLPLIEHMPCLYPCRMQSTVNDVEQCVLTPNAMS